MQSTEPTSENWMPVVGYEGRYEVSDLGRVRSCDRQARTRGTSTRFHPGRVLKGVANAGGRVTVSLPDGAGGQKTRLVHHLVLEAFSGPRPDGTEACHWDGDASNNRLSNLRWDSHLSNEADKARHGTHASRKKTHCPLGHPLVEPNLVFNELARGHRRCRACNAARATAYLGRHDFSKEFADEKFERFMREGATQ